MPGNRRRPIPTYPSGIVPQASCPKWVSFDCAILPGKLESTSARPGGGEGHVFAVKPRTDDQQPHVLLRDLLWCHFAVLCHHLQPPESEGQKAVICAAACQLATRLGEMGCSSAKARARKSYPKRPALGAGRRAVAILANMFLHIVTPSLSPPDSGEHKVPPR